MNIRTRHQDRIEWTPLSPNQHAAWVSQQVSESEADILQHGQERRGLHVGDPDLILVLGQFSVEHGVEDGAADSKDVLTRPKAGRQTDSERRWLRPPSNIHHFLVVVFSHFPAVCYLVSRHSLCPTWRSDHKVDVSHRLIVEHD